MSSEGAVEVGAAEKQRKMRKAKQEQPKKEEDEEEEMCVACPGSCGMLSGDKLLFLISFFLRFCAFPTATPLYELNVAGVRGLQFIHMCD